MTLGSTLEACSLRVCLMEEAKAGHQGAQGLGTVLGAWFLWRASIPIVMLALELCRNK